MSKIRNLLLILMVVALFGSILWIRNLSTSTPALETPNEENVTVENQAADDSVEGATDADGVAEESSTDAERTDADSTDTESTDADSTDAESTDADSTDADSTDADSTDAESTDAESTDASTTNDATQSDAATQADSDAESAEVSPTTLPEEIREPRPELELSQWENPFVQVIAENTEVLNPILNIGETTQAIADKIYPRLLGQDPQNGALVPTELAQDWSVAEDGLTYTFELREDITWSDGEPVTAQDFKFTYDAMAAASASPLNAIVSQLAEIEVLDDYEVAVTLADSQCTILQVLNYAILPSHLFAEDFSDLLDNPQSVEPTVGAGPFVFDSRDDDTFVLARNDSYWQGEPAIDAWIYEVVPDADDRWQAAISGEADLAKLEKEQLAEISLDGELDVTFHQDKLDSFNFIALNLADPTQPLPGRDAEDKRARQPAHPILGDKDVRLAMAYALDYEEILSQVYQGQGYPLASYVLPTSWAYDDSLEPYAYDPEKAVELLEEAGWVVDEESGIRTFDGEPLSVQLITNEDNAQRMLLGDIVEAQLAEVGIEVDFQPMGFNNMVQAFLSQSYDMAILGWENLGPDPGNSLFWSSETDIPGAGFNTTSFQNASVDRWLEQALEMPGCGQEGRTQLYQQIQKRVYQEQPYIIIGGMLGTWVYADRWQGIEPGPWQFDHNVHEWE